MRTLCQKGKEISLEQMGFRHTSYNPRLLYPYTIRIYIQLDDISSALARQIL